MSEQRDKQIKQIANECFPAVDLMGKTSKQNAVQK